MTARRGGIALGAILATIVAAGPTEAATSITMTSPADGSVVSRSQTPSLALAGGLNFDTPQAVQTQYFLRHGTCTNATTDTRSLSTTFSNGDAQNCGYNGTTTPLNEVGPTIGVNRVTERFPMEDASLPVTLDATKPATGTLRLSTFNANGVGTGVGLTTIDFALSGTINGTTQNLGTTSVTYQQLPGAVTKDVTWSITLPSSADKKDATSFELAFTVRGINVLHGWVWYRGLSHTTIPEYTASFDRKVEIAVDSGPFSSAGVTVAPDLSGWTGSMPTPAVGGHFIRARAVQGGQVAATVSNVVNVAA